MLLLILFPGLSLILHKRPGLGAFLLVCQVTLVGWVVGALLAARHRRRERRRQRSSGHWRQDPAWRLLY